MLGGTVAQRAVIGSVAIAVLASTAVAMAPVGTAAVCGPGTLYDAPTDSCLVAAAPAPPRLPAPAELAPAPPPLAPAELAPPPPPPPPPLTPHVTASICAPIPFVNLCVGI